MTKIVSHTFFYLPERIKMYKLAENEHDFK